MNLLESPEVQKDVRAYKQAVDKIVDEKNQSYSVEEFVKLISKWKIRS